MPTTKFEKLREVDIRELWTQEQYGFILILH